MSKNIIQFQEGLSLPKFLEIYGSEEQCYSALYKLRWPNGFLITHNPQPTLEAYLASGVFLPLYNQILVAYPLTENDD